MANAFTSAASREQPAAPAPERRAPRFDTRYAAPMMITVILLAADRLYGVLEPRNVATAVVSSILFEIVCGLLAYRKVPHLASAYVSGISVGLILKSPFLLAFVLCAGITIVSKYVLRVNGRHLWNPSNFAIVAMLWLAPHIASGLSVQFGNQPWAMLVIWALGAIIISRLKRFHICAVYAASFVAFAALRSAVLHTAFVTEVSPITGPPYQLFVFFMVTDPKSTVRTVRGQSLVAFLVAAMECVLRFAGDIHVPYDALFLVGPVANLIEILRDKRKA